MKISLITVCYNAEKTIATAMESVLTQQHGDTEIEYIVVDGGSADSTVDIIKKFAEQFHCSPSPLTFTFRWLSEKDNGMYDALNKGMKMATGGVIGLLNADDVLAEDDTLAKIAAAFADPTIDGTYGDIRFVREDDHCTPTTYASVRSLRTVRYCSGKWFRPWMFRFGTQTAHPSTFFRKECFAKWGDYSLDYGMYDALNKGIRMATGDVIGILNADDVLAEDDTLVRIVRLFECSDCSIDGCYGDIRFVRELGGPTVRYCSGKWFRPWMFRFGTQTAHPSTFFRKECFAKWGDYSLDYGMYGDFELLCRFIWKNKAKMKYLPICTTVMRMGGASTNGWRTTLKINRSDLRALKANGCWSCLPLLYLRYLAKIWGFVFRGL